MDSRVKNDQTTTEVIAVTVKEECMDRSDNPSNMSTDENNTTENLSDLDAVIARKKQETNQTELSSNGRESDHEESHISKESNISPSEGSDLSKKDNKVEKSTGNRILKRKNRKFDWEVIIINEDLVSNSEEKIDVKEHKLMVSNFPTHWGENELKEFILKLYSPVDMFYMSIDERNYFVGSIQLHFSTKDEWQKAWNAFNGKYADDQRIFAYVDDFADSDNDTENAEPPVKRGKGNTEPEDSSKTDVEVWENDPRGLYGLKPEFLQTLGITPPIDRWVHVSNVKCDKTELKQVMELAGEVLKTSISTTLNFVANVKYAKVMYSHPLEAVQAVSMLNDQELYGAKLKVTMCHPGAKVAQILPKGLRSVGPGLGAMGIHLRDVVQQYERYVKGFDSELNTSIFLDLDGNDFSKTAPRNGQGNYSQAPLTLNMMPLRQNLVQQPLPSVPYEAGNFGPSCPINYGPQNIPGPMGHPVGYMGPMPNPGAPVPMVPNVIQDPVRPIGPIENRPVCLPHQIVTNIPITGPRVVGPNVMPVLAPIGQISRPGNPGVGQRGAVGVNVALSPCISPRPSSTSLQFEEQVSVELTNLPLSSTFPLLCEKMAQCGAVTSLQLGAPGCAVVQFANRASAEKCYNHYNGCLVMGNVIEVKFL